MLLEKAYRNMLLEKASGLKKPVSYILDVPEEFPGLQAVLCGYVNKS